MDKDAGVRATSGPNWLLCWQWLAASVGAGGVAAAVNWLIQTAMIAPLLGWTFAHLGASGTGNSLNLPLLLISLSGGTVAALLHGSFEWLVLRQHLPDAWRWIVARLVGSLIGGLPQHILVAGTRDGSARFATLTACS